MLINIRGRVDGTSMVWLVALWITDHYHLSSNLGVGISEGCFVFDFASLTFTGRSARLAYHVHKGGRKTSVIIINVRASDYPPFHCSFWHLRKLQWLPFCNLDSISRVNVVVILLGLLLWILHILFIFSETELFLWVNKKHDAAKTDYVSYSIRKISSFWMSSNLQTYDISLVICNMSSPLLLYFQILGLIHKCLITDIIFYNCYFSGSVARW